MKIDNRPDDAHPIHWKHFVIHSINAGLVFLAGIGADVVIVRWLHTRPTTVRWQSGEVQTNYVNLQTNVPAIGVTAEVGLTRDGNLVWRVK